MSLTDSLSTVLDDQGVQQLLSEKVKLQTWLDVESALATAQAENGLIPKKAAIQIKQHAKVENLDLKKMAEIKRQVGHGFVPFVKVFVQACDSESGKYVHYGATTQNIQQSSQNIILKQINHKFLAMTKTTLLNLATLAENNATSVMAGRTHGKHAIPITYGYKVSTWLSDMLMSLDRLEQLEPRVFTIMMGGAVGAFNSVGVIGPKIQARVGELLDMPVMMIPSRAIHTPQIEYINALALLANNCETIAEEVFQTSIEEFGEVSEPFQKGTIGSSTMPHKINPKLSKGIIANAQKLYSLTQVGYYSSARPFEADSSSNMLFDGLLTEAVGLMREILIRMIALTKSMQVHVSRLYTNATINHGIDNSEYVMMTLAAKIGKDRAHAVVYQMAIDAEVNHKSYQEILLKNELLRQLFSKDEIINLLKPENYTGLSKEITLKTVKLVRQRCAK